MTTPNEAHIINQYQVAIFLKNTDDIDVSVFYKLAAETVDHFDSSKGFVAPMSGNSNTDDFPRAILKSTNGDREVLITSKKIAIIWRNIDSDEDFSINAGEIATFSNKILSFFPDKVRITRIGYIIELYLKSQGREVEIITDRFITNPSAEALTGFSISLNYREREQGLTWNKVLSLITGKLNSNPEEKILIIRYDLNTIEETDLNSEKQDLNNLLVNAMKRSVAEDIKKQVLNGSG